MKALYDSTAVACSQRFTEAYSTSFAWGIRCLGRPLRGPIHAIYGFVRLADEVVDSFGDHDRATLLARLRKDTALAIAERISVNPVLHAFQAVVHRYGIGRELVDAFLDSMAMDLVPLTYQRAEHDRYIHGSAEVVGLMCLRVFCQGDGVRYTQLAPAAIRLGAAFQKVNFLRDLRADHELLGRSYFPGVAFHTFDDAAKRRIEQEVREDLTVAWEGIRRLPCEARFGVQVAYTYYRALFRKIERSSAARIRSERVRISNGNKLLLVVQCCFRYDRKPLPYATAHGT